MYTDRELLHINRHILSGHHTDAHIFQSYGDALDTANCLGITAQPQQNQSKPGWCVVIVLPDADGPAYYTRRATA